MSKGKVCLGTYAVLNGVQISSSEKDPRALRCVLIAYAFWRLRVPFAHTGIANLCSQIHSLLRWPRVSPGAFHVVMPPIANCPLQYLCYPRTDTYHSTRIPAYKSIIDQRLGVVDRAGIRGGLLLC